MDTQRPPQDERLKMLTQRQRKRAPRLARPAPEGQELLIADEAAHLLGVARSTLFAMSKQDGFPPRILLTGNRGGWLRSDLIDWLKARRAAASKAS
jgi:predicted DNA-binding transcriptional regulator AlpA